MPTGPQSHKLQGSKSWLNLSLEEPSRRPDSAPWRGVVRFEGGA
ncbi:hypothetical protein M758_1G022400 [Ceratodon purpureus]|nr:hypothetical protein M758_1G022400 [Ceratodon purpureus]